MSSNQDNKVALVTGGNKGIGYETVKQLSEAHPKWTILLGTRSAQNGADALKKLNSPSNVKVLVLDVEKDESVAAALKEVQANYKKVDVLINNAGLYKTDNAKTSARTVINTNLFGVHRVTKAFGPLIPDGGNITIVSSEIGAWTHHITPASTRAVLESPNLTYAQIEKLGNEYLELSELPSKPHAAKFPAQNTGMPMGEPYGASKLLVSAYGRLLARDYKPRHIVVSIICPGYCATDINGNDPNAPRSAADGARAAVQGSERSLADTGKFTREKDILADAREIPEDFAKALAAFAAKQAQEQQQSN